MQTIRITTSQNIDIDYEIAGIGDRILGYLIDFGIFFALFILVIVIDAIVVVKGRSDFAYGISFIIFLVLYVFYDLICEIFFNGQSIGKMVMKIKVVSLDGGRPTVGQYMLRWLFRIVDFTLTSGVCAVVSTAVSTKGQRVGDIVANTTLIRTTPRTNRDNMAFSPMYEGYIPVFPNVVQLTDKDIALLHEVLESFRKSGNSVMIYNTARHVSALLAVTIPVGMDDLQFLQILIKDYNHLMAVAAEAAL